MYHEPIFTSRALYVCSSTLRLYGRMEFMRPFLGFRYFNHKHTSGMPCANCVQISGSVPYPVHRTVPVFEDLWVLSLGVQRVRRLWRCGISRSFNMDSGHAHVGTPSCKWSRKMAVAVRGRTAWRFVCTTVRSLVLLFFFVRPPLAAGSCPHSSSTLGSRSSLSFRLITKLKCRPGLSVPPTASSCLRPSPKSIVRLFAEFWTVYSYWAHVFGLRSFWWKPVSVFVFCPCFFLFLDFILLGRCVFAGFSTALVIVRAAQSLRTPLRHCFRTGWFSFLRDGRLRTENIAVLGLLPALRSLRCSGPNNRWFVDSRKSGLLLVV